MPVPFSPPRGGRGSQSDNKTPVPSAFWQPPESVAESDFYGYKSGAFFLGWAGEKPVGIRDDRHIVMVAGARGGKTSTVLKPNLQLYEGAALILDPKGELASQTAKARADLGHAVHVLDPWGVADVPDNLRAKFDPLAELLNAPDDELIDDAALMADALIQDGGTQGSDHWVSAARDFVRGAILHISMTFQRPSLDLLPEFLADCMAVTPDTPHEDNPFVAMADFVANTDRAAEVADVIRNAGRGMMGTNAKERSSIMSTARNQLGFLESRPMRRSLERSSFKLAELKEGKSAGTVYSLTGGETPKPAVPVSVYLCLPASRMGTHAKWLRLFLNMTIAALERSRAKPALPVLLMLEEFAALGHLRALEQAAAYMAGFSLRMVVVVQDLTQLQRHYKEGWQSFLGNSGALITFANTDQTSLDYVSKRLGDTFVYLTETNALGSGAAAAGAPATRENFQKVPLMAAEEIARHFGRRYMRCLVMPADGPPVALDRRFLTASDIATIRKGATR